jgi:hypothetical protein
VEHVPHIFSVVAPGFAENHDIPGFHAVGVGRDIALGELYQFESEVDESLDVVLYEAFDAKATAELIQGVGYEWDCSVLTADREPVEITKAVRAAIEGLLREGSTSPYNEEWGSDFDKIPKWKATINKFTSGILTPEEKRPKHPKKQAAKPRLKSVPRKLESKQ